MTLRPVTVCHRVDVGFWDFVAPDLATFDEFLEARLPPFVAIPGVGLLPRAAVISLAWADPASGAGLAARIGLALADAGGTPASAGVAAQGIHDQVEQLPGQEIQLRGSTIMGALVIANVYRCAVEMTSGGRSISNIVHVEGTASGQQAAAAAAVLAAWKVATGPLSQLSSLVTMVNVTAMDLSSTSGGISVVTDTTAGGITTTNSLATRGACALIKLNGGTRDRSTRGRIYYGPIMEQDIDTDGASVVASHKNGFNTAFNAFKTSLSGASFTLGVASRKHSLFTSVGSLTCETTIATQRRRIRS